MVRRTQTSECDGQRKPGVEEVRRQNKTDFQDALAYLFPEGRLFADETFHGNTKWTPEGLVSQALLWSWQDTTNVTDAFKRTLENGEELGIEQGARTYTAFIDALARYEATFTRVLRQRFQALAEEMAGKFWRFAGWVLFGFDGSRVNAPRSQANEREFCAQGYGTGTTAKYRKKKTKGMRRRKNERSKPEPQRPQAWITMIWHMRLRLPWTWRLGPSNSSERSHVSEILAAESFPENSLFCGDAGFVGYDLWSSILAAKADFLVRVGANVNLLSEQADIQRINDNKVLCWPKGKMNSGAPPLVLRLVKVKLGKTKMWMLTNVLDSARLPPAMIVKIYKMRWGIEVAYRGLKQTLDKRHLRCRNSDRVYVELDWSIRGMAFAELLALREQIQNEVTEDEPDYDPKRRSLANTMSALRGCLRNLAKFPQPDRDLFSQLKRSVVQRYENHTNKKARYRPKNPDKKKLGDPKITKFDALHRKKLDEYQAAAA